LREDYFDELSDILAKDNPTELEENIIASIYWFGQGVDTATPKKDQEKTESEADLEFFKIQERFLKMVVALEAILIVGREGQKTKKIAKRGAYLLEKDDLEHRSEIYEEIRQAYITRSEIVHEGATEVTFNETYRLLYGTRNIIFNFLREMRSEVLETEEDLKDWAEQNVEAVDWKENSS